MEQSWQKERAKLAKRINAARVSDLTAICDEVTVWRLALERVRQAVRNNPNARDLSPVRKLPDVSRRLLIDLADGLDVFVVVRESNLVADLPPVLMEHRLEYVPQ